MLKSRCVDPCLEMAKKKNHDLGSGFICNSVGFSSTLAPQTLPRGKAGSSITKVYCTVFTTPI